MRKSKGSRRSRRSRKSRTAAGMKAVAKRKREQV